MPGSPVSVSAAYSGRIAVAYRSGHSFHRKSQEGQDPDTNYVNLYVAIYECESTGGSEWVLEDRILLKNVELPKVDLPNVELPKVDLPNMEVPKVEMPNMEMPQA